MQSHGAVTRMDTLWRGAALPGGFFDPDIFGPLDGSEPRWGHLDVSCGVLIDGERVMQIPVPPIAQRAPLVVDDPAANVLWHGPVNAAWIDLLAAIRIHDRLVELGPPDAMIAGQVAHVQRHYEDVVALMRGERPAPHHHAHEERPGDRYLMMPCPPAESSHPLALLFLDEDRLVVQTTVGCRVVDRTGKESAAWSPTGAFASSVQGDLVVFNAGQRSAWRGACYPDDAWPDDVDTLPLAAYDVAADKWLMVGDERLPPWAIDETDVRDADARDLRTDDQHSLSAPTIDAKQIVQSRDGRFVLARLAKLAMDDDADADGDGDEDSISNEASDMMLTVMEIATQTPFRELADVPADLDIVDLSSDRLAHPFTPPPAAIAYSSELGWRIVDPSGAVGDGERWWFRLEGAGVTAWSPSGAQLAVIAGRELVILDVTPAGAKLASRAQIG
jgi:hypothetical protein